MMKKILMIATAAAFAFLPGFLSAQKKAPLHSQNPFYLRKNEKKPRMVGKIRIDKKGNYRYSLPGSPAEQMIRKEDVAFVWIPKPKEIQNADTLLANGKFEDAAKFFAAAEKKYGELGWYVYCMAKQGESLKKAGKYPEALKILEALQSYKILNPDFEEPAFLEASKLLGETYVNAGKFDKAISFVEKMSAFENEASACSAYLLRGDIYKKRAATAGNKNFRGDMEKAAMAYFQAALLFQKAPTRPEALYKSWGVLKELKDARSEKFAEILRKEYPGNEFTQKLK